MLRSTSGADPADTRRHTSFARGAVRADAARGRRRGPAQRPQGQGRLGAQGLPCHEGARSPPSKPGRFRVLAPRCLRISNVWMPPTPAYHYPSAIRTSCNDKGITPQSAVSAMLQLESGPRKIAAKAVRATCNRCRLQQGLRSPRLTRWQLALLRQSWRPLCARANARSLHALTLGCDAVRARAARRRRAAGRDADAGAARAVPAGPQALAARAAAQNQEPLHGDLLRVR